jgi:adenosylmethionine-8-amino-7-oxononanoate aminotransferase
VHRGVLLRPLGDVVVVMPPLTTTAAEIDRVIDALAESISSVAAEDSATEDSR